MKILFDNQIFELQKYGGISRYFCELFKKFNNYSDIQYQLPIRNSINEYLSKIEPFNKQDLYPHVTARMRGKTLINKILDIFDKNSNKNIVKKALLEQNFDIFHPTYYSPYFLKYLGSKKLVVTIYDMIHEIYPEYFLSDKGKTINNKRKLVMRADKIIAISESTKKDIIKFYNIPEDKIKVIYLGNSLIPSQNELSDKTNICKGYILFVGSRNLYKNFLFFVKSVAPLLKKDPNLKIITTGGGKFSPEETSLFNQLEIVDQISQVSVNDTELAKLYKNAICFVFSSLYEGFGIPILEAMSCDCPAVLSNTSSLPEIGGDAAEYFDPMNSDNILNAVSKVINNKELRKMMILKGKEQLKKFSWDKTAKETVELYRDIL